MNELRAMLDGIKAGDQVWIEFRSYGNLCKKYERVAHVTRTQIALDDEFKSHFYRASGVAVSFSSRRITGVATEAEIADFNVQAAVQKSRERILQAEESELMKLMPEDGAELLRNGDYYSLRLEKMRGTTVRMLLAALREARSTMPGTI